MDKIAEITIKKTLPGHGNHYILLTYDAFFEAIRNLTYPAFKFWCWLASRGNDWIVKMYPQTIKRYLNFESMAEYKSALQELADKEYLKYDEEDGWIFYERR